MTIATIAQGVTEVVAKCRESFTGDAAILEITVEMNDGSSHFVQAWFNKLDRALAEEYAEAIQAVNDRRKLVADAQHALQRMHARSNESVDEWSTTLAADLAKIRD